ncbi:hypothetical protein H6P81_021252 [Aristolochia fimbriata]|uniref:Uncharacterized protein n=1 Tax=Aristolochia fimbriata TaxID=158543 RepID=A0AAV7DQL7_ARIFI|nr:hypothetical protein H6P81_021252 [Aristolochia fimbriata]
MSSADRFAEAKPLNQKEGAMPHPTNGISKITLKVVVFHFRRRHSPTYPTPLKSFHKVGLESSSTGSFSPLILPSPLPLAVVSLDKHWAEITLREHPQGPSQCFVLIKQSDSPCPHSVLSRLFDAGRPPKGPLLSPSPPGIADDPPRQGSSSSSPPTADGFDWDPAPSPPSQSFSPRAVHLGDLMRYEYDQAYALGPPDFQGSPGAPTPRDAAVLFQPLDPTSAEPLPGGAGCPRRRLRLPNAAANRHAPFRNFNPIPFRGSRMHAYLTGFPCLLGSTNPCASAAHMEPFPFRLQSSHLNICYYHQDLHRRPPAQVLKAEVFMGSRQGLLPSSRPGCCPRRPVWVARFKPSIFGLVDSAALAVGHREPAFVHPASPNSHAGLQLSRGKLRGNQLLDGSISLSPLYPSQTNDLHRQIAMGLHQSFSLFASPGRHSSPSFGPGSPLGDPANQLPLALYGFGRLTDSHTCRLLGPCFKTGRMGSPLADAKSASRCHEGTPAEVATPHPPRSQRRRSAGGIIRPGLVAPRTRRPPLTEFTASIWAAFPNNPTRRQRQKATGSGHNGLSPSLGRPIPWDLRPSVAGRLQTTLNGRKAADSHTGLFPFAATTTRGILQGLRVTEATAGQGSFQSQGLDTHFEPRRAREGGATTVRAGALGAKCFSANLARGARTTTCSLARRLTPDRPPGGQQGTGGENTPGGRPGRCTLDLVASGATCAQRLDGSRDSAIHTKHRDFATLFIDARAKISAVESWLGYRVRGRTAKPPSFFRLAQIAPKVVVRGVRPPTVRWVADAEPAGRRSLTPGRGFDGRCDSPPPPPGHRGAARSLGSRRFRESTMILPQVHLRKPLLRLLLPLNDKVQWTSRNAIGRRTANAAADPTLHRPFNRQIAPPTKNGHAPPPIESRKSSQSVNPYYVRPAGITAAAGTGLALQWILVKGFRLYLFHYQTLRARYCYLLSLPPPVDWDQPGSILSRDATPTRRRCEKRQHRARGIDGRKQKLGDQTRFANPTKSIGLPHFTWVHEHCGVRALQHTRAETKPEGKVNADASIAPRLHSHDTGPGDGFQRDYTSYEAAPFGKKNTQAPGECQRPNKAAGAKQSHRRRTGKSRSGEGAPNGPAESVKDQKLEVGQKGRAGPLGLFPAREEELKAIAQRKRGANGLCTAHTLRGKPLHRARGQQALPRRAEGRQAFLSTQGGQQAQAYPRPRASAARNAPTAPATIRSHLFKIPKISLSHAEPQKSPSARALFPLRKQRGLFASGPWVPQRGPFFFAFAAQRVPPLPWRGRECPLASGAAGRACRPRGASQPPPLFGPKDDRYLGRFAGSQESRRLPGVRRNWRLRPESGEPRRSTLLFSLMCLGPTAAGTGGEGRIGRPPPTRPAKGRRHDTRPGSRKAPNAGRQAGGRRWRRSSLDSDLEALSHNPTHEHRAEITLREHPQGPSQCFVLIKQSDSPCPHSVLSRVVRRRKAPKGALLVRPRRASLTTRLRPLEQLEQSTDSRRVRLGPPPSPRANPFPEAVHLGDLMRYEYDQAYALGPPDFQGSPGAPTPRDAAVLFQPLDPTSAEPLPGPPADASRLPNAAANRHAPFRNFNPIPFRDLHRRPPRQGSRPEVFMGRRQASYSSRPGCCPDGRYGSRFKPSIFGLVDSAGMLTLEPFSEDLGRSTVQPARGSRQSASFAPLRVWSPADSHTCQTPWSVFQDGSNGEPAGRRQERRRCHEGTPAEVAKPPSSVTETTIRWAGSSAWLGRLATQAGRRLEVEGRTALAVPAIMTEAHRRPHPLPPRQFQALFDSFFKVLFIFPSRRDRVRAQRVVTPLWRPIPWDLRRPSAEDACRLHFNGRKAADSHTGLFPFAAATRGILVSFSPPLIDMLKLSGCSHLTWGRIRARPPSRRQLPGRGPLQSQGLDTTLRATQGQGGRSHHCRGPGALGAKCFSANLARGGKDDQSARPDDSPHRPPGGQQGTGGENTPGGRPGRCTLDLVASGATCAQRLDGSRDSAIHTKHRDFATLFIGARAKISAVESRLGYRVRGRRRTAKDRFFFLLRWHRSPKVVVRGVRPRPPLAADAEPAGRRVANARRGIRRALRLPPPPPLGIVVQLARLVARRFAESTMILPQLRRPEHLRASQTCYCLKLPGPKRHSPSKKLAGRHRGTTRQLRPGAIAVEGTKSTCAHREADRRPNPRSNYEAFNCKQLKYTLLSWNYRCCWHRTCPPMDPR